MAIAIRKLQPQESSIYREVRLACLKNLPQYFGYTYEEESLNPKLRFELFIESDAQEQFMFGLFDHEKLIGIAGFDRMERKRVRHRGELVQVYVDSDYRGQNLGEKLVRRILEHAFSLDGLEQAQLGVIAGNETAIALYEKLGFKTFGIQPNSVKVGNIYMDQLFMQLFKSDYQG